MTKDELNNKLFSASDLLRGKMDAADYKNYLLALLFYKYISDTFLAEVIKQLGLSVDSMTLEEQIQAYQDCLNSADRDGLIEILEAVLSFTIAPENLYQSLIIKINKDTFNLQDLKAAFTTLASTYSQFEGLFDMINLEATQLGANAQQRAVTVSGVMKKLDEVHLSDYRGDAIGDAYEYLIGQFAAESGKKAGEFYTPHEISDLITRIVTQGKEDMRGFTVYDPTMGSGSLMLNARKYMNHPKSIKYYGQESNFVTYNLARMNLILHGVNTEDMHLNFGDTLGEDWPSTGTVLFDATVMNPPYSAKWSADASKETDDRFAAYGKVAPKSAADFAFLLHGFYHLKETGVMGIVLPHGVLFRGGREGTIRQRLLENGSIDTVIGLPPNLFFGTSIPTCIVILKKNRSNRDVYFIDASQEFTKGKNQNKLEEEHIQKIVAAYTSKKEIEKYAHLASFDELQENDFNLNIPRYVDTFEEEEPVDMAAIGREMSEIRAEKAKLEKEILAMLQDLTYSEDDAEWMKGAIEVFSDEK